ncbi:MAG TPA: beta-hydroxyacyl-ACP dehydratase [Phycisphaerae bacterium]|nr:beta-hydroxyacyl-ACP dehydratase [Phycisphaerales bacterium]HRX85614.1 beta-hydroxyacyl-ACP dehydratase [Phycisphaerae bacterium]
MPPPLLIDLDQINTDEVQYDHEFIYSRLPHRFEFELLDGVCRFDREAGLSVAFCECRADAWWARGHVPGRPIMPGVLQLEAGAQLVAFSSRYVNELDVFVGFGGVENCRFREAVIPPCRLILISKITENRSRRVVGDVQGVVDGRLVFHATIAGLAMPDAK